MFNQQSSLSSRRETLFTPSSSSSSSAKAAETMDSFDMQFEQSTEGTSMLAVPSYPESQHSYGSRPPSLSPSFHTAAPLPGTSHLSPPSSASPSSTFSSNMADDYLLNTSFNSADLDMFFQQQDVDMSAVLDGINGGSKPGHSLSIPNFGLSPTKPTFNLNFGMGDHEQSQQLQSGTLGYSQPSNIEDIYDMSSFLDVPTTPTHVDNRRFSATSLDGSINHYDGTGNTKQHQYPTPVPVNWGNGASLNAWTLEQARRSLSAASSTQASQSLTLDDLSSQLAAASSYSHSPQSTSSWRGLSPPALQHGVATADVSNFDDQIRALEAARIQVQARLAVNAATCGPNNETQRYQQSSSGGPSPVPEQAVSTRIVAPIPPRAMAPLPSKRTLLPSTSKPTVPPAPRGGAAPRRNVPKVNGGGPAAPVGKHNKTEKRYRQKVQAAQTDLRDAVPALRVLYGTSTEEQLVTTDIKADDGTVDGLGEVTRPNASAKATVLVGARMYIELLQRRVAKLERRVGELEEFRRDIGGEAAFVEWNQAIFDREALIDEAIQRIEADKLAEEAEQGDSDDDEDDISDPAPKAAKRARTTPAAKKPTKVTKKEPKVKGGKHGKDDPNFGSDGPSGSSGSGVRVFAAFAMSFSLIPSASTLFRHSTTFASSQSRGHVISRLPLVTAEHSSRILAKALPGKVAPHADSLLDWGWRLIVAIVLGVLVGPIVERWWYGSALLSLSDEELEKLEGKRLKTALGIGAARGVATEVVRLCASWIGLPTEQPSAGLEQSWTRAASNALAQGPELSLLSRIHFAFRLNRTATTPLTFALLALLQPRIPMIAKPEANWKSGRMLTTATTSLALKALLDLPLHEAKQVLAHVSPTSAPLASMANHVTLLHLNDMFSRFFIALVHSSTSQLRRPSITAMLANIDKRGLGAHLPPATFKEEIRVLLASVPHGTPARALALVLTGLWSVFNQSATQAQAALASSLAAEQMQGSGASLSSVTALLELLWPGSSGSSPGNNMDESIMPLNDLAKQTDVLALVCVRLVHLLSSTSTLPGADASRADRLDASTKVKDATLQLRAMLALPAFERSVDCGGNDEEEEVLDYELSDTVSESGSLAALHQEKVAFGDATERLVEVLTAVGRRAVGRRDGRDQDSGIEGDIEEL